MTCDHYKKAHSAPKDSFQCRVQIYTWKLLGVFLFTVSLALTTSMTYSYFYDICKLHYIVTHSIHLTMVN